MDEILRKLYDKLSKSADTFVASKGSGQDLLGAKIKLTNPRARISATSTRGRLISALAEFCWYMSGSADLDFIRFYIKDYPPKEASGSIEEAYGPRLIGTGEFGRSVNQIERVIDLLQKKPDTRRALISIIEANDLEPNRSENPCTVALQFICRRSRLHMITMMRSNDAYMGFVHDVFCFTMIQELIARSLDVEVGDYHHFATSLHLYEHNSNDISRYLNEGYQNPTFAMPEMPSGCQRDNLAAFLITEKSIRQGKITTASQIDLPTYWRDLSLVLLRHADGKLKRGNKILEENFSQISDSFYMNFFLRKPKTTRKSANSGPTQIKLDLGDRYDS